jgi:hypothetical protein
VPKRRRRDIIAVLVVTRIWQTAPSFPLPDHNARILPAKSERVGHRLMQRFFACLGQDHTMDPGFVVADARVPKVDMIVAIPSGAGG